MVYKRRTVKSSCGQWNWKHFSWQPRERWVAFIPHDFIHIRWRLYSNAYDTTLQLKRLQSTIKLLNVPINTETTHVRPTVTTAAQRSNTKFTEWTYRQNYNCHILTVEIERLRIMLSFFGCSLWNVGAKTSYPDWGFIALFLSSLKTLEAISLNHDHILHRVRVLATTAQRRDGYYYYYYYGSTNPYLKSYISHNTEETPSLPFPNTQAQ